MKRYFVVIIFLVVLLLGQKIIVNHFFNKKQNVENEEIKVEQQNNQTEKKEEQTITKTEKYSGIDKLMIVAHPDDESYWGGAHLLEDNYLVVCITCGTLQHRVTEFKKAMSLTRDDYIMLGYPDLTNGKKDNWEKVYLSIKKDLEDIINVKQWQQIITHNPEGEYGHIHHKMTNEMVTDLSDSEVLWYFGRYYTKEKIKEVKNVEKISNSTKKIKEQQLIPIYKSQKNAENAFKHMFDYEDFIFNKNWQINL